MEDQGPTERLRLRLPCLRAGNSSCRLPLSDVSAAALLSALLEVDSAVRRDRFEAALRGDPALTIWCAVHPRRKDAPHDLGELATWLDTNALVVLSWQEHEASFPVANSTDCNCRDAERAARSLALANAAERLARPGNPRQVRLLAFLFHAFEWLLSGAAPRVPDALEHLAPPWLRRMATQLNERFTDDEVMNAVIRASKTVSDADAATFDELKETWSREIPWASESLPRLTARLARLQDLEGHFNTMLRQEKLASLQKLAYGASHEINNPLANIATRAQTLLQDEADPERQRALATINDQAFRAFEMIANMMLFSKPPELNLAPTDLGQLVLRAAAEMQPAAQQQGTTLRMSISEAAHEILADATQLAVLFRALVRNALEAVECGGEVEIAVGPFGGDRIQLSVRDTGPGLSDEARRHLFDPFYSSREAGRGLGFGLSWCWTIVEQHRGEMAFESEPGRTVFVVTLPVTVAD